MSVASEQLKIEVVLLDRRPPYIRSSTLSESFSMASSWLVNFQGRVGLEERRYFQSFSSRASRDVDLKNAHRELLRGLRPIGPNERIIGITRKCLPGGWMSISDYEQKAIVSVHRWDSVFAPPPVEVFIAKEILVYCLIFSSARIGEALFHEETRGCLFDAYHQKRHVLAGLWGHICSGCRTALRNYGLTSERQDEAIGILRHLVGVDRSLLDATVGDYFSCFISYGHVDHIFADRLYDELQGRGVGCWLDEHDMKPGDRILDVVNDAIRLHDKILLCCSETSLNSWWVKDEIRKAQERERREGRDIIIPLMVDRYLLDGWEDGLAVDLRSRLAADFTGWETDNAKFEEQFERVVRALRVDETAREKAPDPKL